MVRHGGSSAGSYLADPTSPIPSHFASSVTTSTLGVKVCCLMFMFISFISSENVAVCYFRKTIISGRFNVPHPSDLSIFEDQVYVADLTQMAVLKASKFRPEVGLGTNITEIYTNKTDAIKDMMVVHPLSQPQSKMLLLL